jgi:hypothetical protein
LRETFENSNDLTKMKLTFLVIALFILIGISSAQQIPDTTWQPVINSPEYATGLGSVVFIDEGHHNFHTKNNRYKPFSNLLEKDGYRVREYRGEFEKKKLTEGKILVIANALNKMNVTNWYLPTPSAFTGKEIQVVKDWVAGGGSLFLIADHMPMAGAATMLASVFGFEFSNGFALDLESRGPSLFSLNEKTLAENIITRGRDTSESVHKIYTFTGQAFKLPEDASPILIFPRNYLSFMPDTAWQFNANTRKTPVEGWSQGGYKKFGKGRVVIFGEAAMFTAQLAGPDRVGVGMNADDARENYKLLLNIIHWLDGRFD